MGALLERWKTVEKTLRRAAKKITPDRVHDARVAIRRMDALLELLKSVAPARAAAKLRKRLCKPLQRLGPVRDLHVQAEALAALSAEYPQMDGVIARHARQEKKAVRDAREYAESLRIKRLRKRWRAVVEEVGLQLANARQDRHRAFAIAALDQSFARVSECRRAISSTDLGSIHRMRVAFKRFRYKAEVLQPLLRRAGPRLMSAMQSFQTRMGEVNDLHVLVGTITALRGKDARLGPVLDELNRGLMLAADGFVREADEVYRFWRTDFVPERAVRVEESP
ncbi:MAG: CHAD domain-containing protein [Armatimonadetes bacterium]|nr:CHAD domain-containing protein [Armatimonadota bacterium]